MEPVPPSPRKPTPGREDRDLYGLPDPLRASWLGLAVDLIQRGRAGRYIWESRRIQGWVRGAEADALWQAGDRLPGSPVIVEIGAFLGCSTVLLAGTRKLRGCGKVHTIDPFDGGGDSFSLPIYHAIAADSKASIRERFDSNMRRAGVTEFIEVHPMTAAAVRAGWTRPIDMLYLDGDHSPSGARNAFVSWTRFLRVGGVVAINNSAEGNHPPGHDGSVRVVREFLTYPAYDQVRRVEALTFATKGST
jgi:predicted O-methyltransferase YrrM